MTRRGWAIATASAASLLAVLFTAVAVLDPLPRVIWNASASAPLGLYRLQPERDPQLGTLVAVAPPKPLGRWMAERGYLGAGVPLLKHIAAKAGQRVCRNADVVSVDFRPVATALERDRLGRSLPYW